MFKHYTGFPKWAIITILVFFILLFIFFFQFNYIGVRKIGKFEYEILICYKTI